MIKLSTLDSEHICKLLSCIFSRPTTRETYVYIRKLFDLTPPEDAVDVGYCVLSSIQTLAEINSYSSRAPSITKEVILGIIENNLYSEIKENRENGFKEFALIVMREELDPFNEASLVAIYKYILNECRNLIERAQEFDYDIEDSLAAIPGYLFDYGEKLCEDIGSILGLMSSNDFKMLKNNHWGWSKFFWKHRIASVEQLPTFLRLTAAYYQEKMYVLSNQSEELTSMSQLRAMRAKYIESSEPLGYWELPILDDVLALRPHEVSIIVGHKGIGKTTLGGFLTAKLLKQKQRILFYCPEIADFRLTYEYVMPAYIYQKYGFLARPSHLVGLESFYDEGSEFSPLEKKKLADLAEIELTSSGGYRHIQRRIQFKSIEDELRSLLTETQPDIVILDHTLVFKGNSNYNEVTAALADALEVLKFEFPAHWVVFSHAGSEFKTPTEDKPIVTSKIVAWSGRLEQAADNICGLFKTEGNRINAFFTKARWTAIPPRHYVYRVDPIHTNFTYEPEDQLIKVSTLTNMVELDQVYADEGFFNDMDSIDEWGDE